MNPIRLGILGPGRIVARTMADVIPHCSNIKVTAIASRDPQRARDAAARYGAEYAYTSYDELAHSDKIDLVYVSTPHAFHCEQAIAMMNAGKNVLCEKPLARNDREVRMMVEAARRNKVFFMEAMWTRFFPASIQLKKDVASGVIGRPRHFFGEFCYASDFDSESRIYAPELAGGALLDVGVYPLMAATNLFGYRPVDFQVSAVLAPSGVDARTCASLTFEGGVTAQFACAVDSVGPSIAFIYGSDGFIEVPHFWCPTEYTVTNSQGTRRVDFGAEANEGYRHEFSAVADLVARGEKECPLVTWEESIAIAGLTTAMREKIGVKYPGE